MQLSVILPVYNVEKYIKTCMESLYAQNLSEEDFEVILVNDGSPDKSIEVLEEFLCRHNNIQVMVQKNSGVSAARNAGLKIAKGEYILFVDPDDIIVPASLEQILIQIKEAEADILVGGYEKKNNDELENWKDISFPIQVTTQEFSGTGRDYFTRFYDPAVGYAVVNLYRRAFLMEKGIRFKAGISFAEDTLFTIDSFLSATTVKLYPAVFYLYRQHSASALSTMSISKLQSLNTVLQEIENLRSQENHSEPVKQKLGDCSFFLFSVLLWYLSHYRSLVKERKTILKDLKKKVHRLFWKKDIKQHFISVCYNGLPSLYIYLRYLFASVRY